MSCVFSLPAGIWIKPTRTSRMREKRADFVAGCLGGRVIIAGGLGQQLCSVQCFPPTMFSPLSKIQHCASIQEEVTLFVLYWTKSTLQSVSQEQHNKAKVTNVRNKKTSSAERLSLLCECSLYLVSWVLLALSSYTHYLFSLFFLLSLVNHCIWLGLRFFTILSLFY